MNSLLEFLKGKFPYFHALMNEIRVTKGLSQYLYYLKGQNLDYGVNDEDIRCFLNNVLNGTQATGFDTNFVQTIRSLVNEYDRLNFARNLPPLPKYGTVEARLAAEFVRLRRPTCYRGSYYLYLDGHLDDYENLVHGHYEPTSRELVNREIMRMFFCDIMGGRQSNLATKIANLVWTMVWEPPVDYYLENSLLIFKDWIAVDLENWTEFPVTANYFTSSSLRFTKQEIEDAAPNSAIIEFIAQREAPNGYVQQWCWLLLRMIAACLVGDSRKKIFVLGGKPSSFKSFIVNKILMNLWVKDAVRTLRPKHISDNFELYGIGRAKVIVISDAEQAKLKTNLVSIVKQISGGDPIPTEGKLKNVGTEDVNAPVILVTNHAIEYDKDEGMDNRIVCLPFLASVSPEDSKWCYEYIENDLPSICRSALKVYQECRKNNCLDIVSPFPCNMWVENNEEFNPLPVFVKNCVVPRIGEFVTAEDIFNKYVEYYKAVMKKPTTYTRETLMKNVKDLLSDLYPLIKDEIKKSNQKKIVNGVEKRGLNDFMLVDYHFLL